MSARCKDHPEAPHGFDRNASHNAGRYVCACDAWEPDEGARMNPLNGYTPGAMGRISFGTPSEGARMSEIELPEPWPMSVIASSKDLIYTAEQVRQLIAAERAEVERLRDVLETLAAQSSGVVGSTSRSDCMAAMAAAAIRR